MLDGLKKLLGMGDAQAAKPASGKRITPKGETTIIIEGKRMMVKNIGSDGLMFGPAPRDMTPGRRVRAELIIQDGNLNLKSEAVLNVTKLEGSSADAKFFYLAPQDKKQIQDYLARYS